MPDSLPISTGPLPDDASVEAQGIDAMPSSLGDIFSGDLSANPTPMLGRALGRAIGAQGVDPVSGFQFAEPEPNIPAAEANARYAIPARPDGSGGLQFSNDLPDSVAASMYQAKRDELLRESVAARRPIGFLPAAGAVGTEIAAGLLDPLNAAASFVPVLGEARYAGWLADAGSALSRTAIRAGVGAAQGVAATAPIALGTYGLGKLEQSDQTAGDALLNVAFGGLIGAAVHPLIGPFMSSDALQGPFKSSPERLSSDALAAAPLSTREAALRSSVAQLVEGRPVEVAPLFTGNELGGYSRTLADLDHEDAAMLAEPAQNPGMQSDLETIRGNKALPQPAQSFMSAIRALGPVKDDGGDLDSLGFNSRSAPGLVSATGKSLDDVAQALGERGWFPEHGTERPSINDLLSAIYDDQHGSPRIHPADLDAVAERSRLGSLDEQLHEQGIDLRSMSNADVERAMSGQPIDRGPATLADHDAQDQAFAQISKDRFNRAARLASGETPLPEDAAASRAADAVKTAPLQNEEIAHLENSVRAQQAAGDLPSSLPELDAANAGVARAEAMRSGFTQAASCLAQAGA